MTDQAQPKNTPEHEIAVQALIWRAADKEASGTPSRSIARDAEYAARQELRKVIDEAGGKR